MTVVEETILVREYLAMASDQHQANADPHLLKLVFPDGEEKVFAVIGVDRFERLLKIAQTFQTIEEIPGMDGEERWAWMSVDASGILQPGDRDPLP